MTSVPVFTTHTHHTHTTHTTASSQQQSLDCDAAVEQHHHHSLLPPPPPPATNIARVEIPHPQPSDMIPPIFCAVRPGLLRRVSVIQSVSQSVSRSVIQSVSQSVC